MISRHSFSRLSFTLLSVCLLALIGVQQSNAQATPTPYPTAAVTFGAIQTNTPAIQTSTPVGTPSRLGCPDEPVSPDGLDDEWASVCSRCVQSSVPTPVVTLPSFVMATVPPLGTASTPLPTIPPLYTTPTLGGVNPPTYTPAPTNTPAPTPTPVYETIRFDFRNYAYSEWVIYSAGGDMPNPFGEFTSNGWESLDGTGGAYPQFDWIGGHWEVSGDIYPNVTSIMLGFTEPYTGLVISMCYNDCSASFGLGGYGTGDFGTSRYGVFFDTPRSIYNMDIMLRDTNREYTIVYLDMATTNVLNAATSTPVATATQPPLLIDCDEPLYKDIDTPIAVIDFGDDEPLEDTCYTVIPIVDGAGIGYPELYFEGLEVCLVWKRLPVVGFFGITFGIDLILVIPIAYLIRRLLTF